MPRAKKAIITVPKPDFASEDLDVVLYVLEENSHEGICVEMVRSWLVACFPEEQRKETVVVDKRRGLK